MRRAEAHAGLGHASAARFAGCQRDPEIRDHRPAIVQQDVFRLDVAMDDAVAVRVVQGTGDFGGDPQRIGDRQLLLPAQPLAQRLAFDVRHDVEEEAVGLAGIEERQDVRMMEVRGGLISLRKRSAPMTAASSGRRTLTATLRSCLRSWAR